MKILNSLATKTLYKILHMGILLVLNTTTDQILGAEARTAGINIDLKANPAHAWCRINYNKATPRYSTELDCNRAQCAAPFDLELLKPTDEERDAIAKSGEIAPPTWSALGYKDTDDCVQRKYLPNIYEILDLDTKDASAADFKKAYHKAAMKLHPDKTTDLSTINKKIAAELFKQASHGQEIVNNPNAKFEYNQNLLNANITRWEPDFLSRFLAERKKVHTSSAGGGTAESKDGSGGGAGDSTGAGTGTGTSGGGGGGGGTGAGTGASEIDRLLRIAEQAAGAVNTALIAGNLGEAEKQATIINDLLDAARTTGDDTGKLKRILKISKEVKAEIDRFKAAHAGGGGGGGGYAESKGGSGGGGGSSTGTSTGTGGGAGTSKPAGKPAGNLDDLQRELTDLYNSKFNNPLELISLSIKNIRDGFHSGTITDNSYLRSLNQDLLSPTDNSVIKLLSNLRTATTRFFADAQANYQWSSGDVANFSKIQDSLNGVAQNIRDLYQQIEDTALERVAIAVGVSELRAEIREIERLIANTEAVPTSTDIHKLENLKRSIDRVKDAAAKQLATNLRAAEKSFYDIQSAITTYLSVLKPWGAINIGTLPTIAMQLTEIAAIVQRRFITKLDRDLEALKTRIEALKARMGSGGAGAGAATDGSTGAGGGAAGTSSFDKIQRDIKRDFDTNFILSRAEEDWTRPGIIGLFTMLVELRPLRPILDKMANLLRALETKRASAPVASLSASEKASIDQLYSNLVIIRDSLNSLLLAANETLSQRLTVGPLFKNAEDLRHAAYSGFMGTSTDSEAVTYQKIQAFVRALDSLEPYSASLDAAKNHAVKYATDAIANIRAISDNNGWLNINTSNLNAWSSRTAWMGLGDGLRNIVQAPYDKLQDLRTTRDNRFNPWLAAHASAAAGAATGGSTGTGGGGGASTGTGAGDAGAVPLPEFRHEYQKLLADKHNVQNLIAVYISFNNTGKNNKAITFAIGALVTPGVKATVDTVNAELRKLITAAGGTVPAI